MVKLRSLKYTIPKVTLEFITNKRSHPDLYQFLVCREIGREIVCVTWYSDRMLATFMLFKIESQNLSAVHSVVVSL